MRLPGQPSFWTKLKTGGVGKHARLCLYLTRMEFEKRFAGTAGGKIWMFVGPLATVATIWIALDFGLGLRATSGPQYGVSLAVGLTVWLFFSEAITSSIGSIVGSPHLVKKVVFPVALLPLTNVMAAFAVHLLLVACLLVAILLQGHGISWTILSLPFWALCLLLLSAGLATLAAALNVLFRDLGALLPNAISLLFWLSPIVWPVANIPEAWRGLVYINPAAVVIQGYRYALLGDAHSLGFFGPALFWVLLIVLLAAVAALYSKVRPLFANVL
jgi:ABC-type polysaccharide/polyol phosphate export permease